jgi:hypothetical protein
VLAANILQNVALKEIPALYYLGPLVLLALVGIGFLLNYRKKK